MTMKLIVPKDGGTLLVPKKRALFAPAILRRKIAENFRTCDISITFRAGAGAPGDVNRGHPASIQPALNSPANPVNGYGVPVVIDTVAANNGVRPIAAGDTAITEIWGVTCRPYPLQQTSNTNFSGAAGLGQSTPPTQQPLDVMRGGYIMVPVVGQSVKGGAVFIWCAASGGGHTQGGFEIVASGGNTAALDAVYQWNSPPDANGIAELIISKF